MNRPCRFVADCVPCVDEESPIRNLSAEDADPITFLSVGFSRFVPQLDELFQALGCVTWCFSGFSQIDADLCAQRQADLCAGKRFVSRGQTCRFLCFDGSVSLFTLPGGLFAGATQAEADAKAHSFTCSVAALLCDIPTPDRFYNIFKHCEVTCADGTKATYDFPAGLIFAATQEAADAQAMAIACQLAELSCPGTHKIYNAQQTCEQTCEDGTTVVMTTPPNTFFGETQEQADELAKAYACSLARIECTTRPKFNQPDTCQFECVNGVTIVTIIPAGEFVGQDQQSADAIAHQFACNITDLQCQGHNPIPTGVSCTVFCPDDSPFTYTLPPNTFVGTAEQAKAYACQMARWHRICLGELESPCCLNAEYNGTIQAFGKSLSEFPFSDFWEITSGSLPPGLTFNGGFLTGGVATITGTPTATGSYDFTVKITNTFGDFMEKSYTLVVATITTSDPLPGATEFNPYDLQLAQTGFVSPLYSIESGNLPNGLHMDASGHITGTPTTSGSFSFTVKIEETP